MINKEIPPRPKSAGRGGPGGPDFVLKEDCDRIYDLLLDAIKQLEKYETNKI